MLTRAFIFVEKEKILSPYILKKMKIKESVDQRMGRGYYRCVSLIILNG